MQVIQIKRDIWQIEIDTPYAVGSVNLYIIKNGEQIMMVDAGVGTQEAWTDFVKGLQELGLVPEDITCVVLTHHHPDHTGFIHYLPQNIALYGHRRVEPWIRKDSVFFTQHDLYFIEYARKLGVPDDYFKYIPKLEEVLKLGGKGSLKASLKEGETIPGFTEWQVVYTPGHAQSHISLFRSSDGLFIGGDVLLEHISSNPIHEPPYHDKEVAPKTFLQYRATLKKVEGMAIQKILPGHGSVFPFTKGLIEERFKQQEERRDKIKHHLKIQARTTFELGELMFRSVIIQQLDLVLSEVQGYLDWLIDSGEVGMEVIDGTVYYRLI